MEIYVRDATNWPEFIGNTREELADNLYRTADDEYTKTVLAWFDSVGSASPLKIPNGSDIETWEVR